MIVLTPRHSVRNLWNEHAIAKHCAKMGNQQFKVFAEDTSKDGMDDLSMEARLAIAEQKDKDTGSDCQGFLNPHGLRVGYMRVRVWDQIPVPANYKTSPRTSKTDEN